MTIGPDPITRTELMSSRLGTDTPLNHELGEPVEQVTGVVRTGRRLRVVLDGEGRHVKTPDALHDVVVEAVVADLGSAVRRLGDAVARGVDGEAVVVRGDLHLAGGAVHHRLV